MTYNDAMNKTNTIDGIIICSGRERLMAAVHQRVHFREEEEEGDTWAVNKTVGE